jgi:dTDP-4-amino-4,6-dideoxygalactose transaminase
MASESELAQRGGPRSVRSRSALRRVQIRRGLLRSWDLLGLLPTTLRGRTSQRDNAGPVARFEAAFAEVAGTRFAIAMNSGTATLHSAYFALGVGPGSEVIVPSYTWQATASPVLQCGAVPVFCDVERDTYTLDPDDLERKISERTRAVAVTHIWGNPARMDRIRAIADRHGLAVVEDCSHAHGALLDGRPVGSWGDVGCFSLQASKGVDAGEGGVAVTSDPELYDRMLLLGHCGLMPSRQQVPSFDLGEMSLGVKYRPHLFAVHMAHASLRRLARRNRQGERAWRAMLEELEGTPGLRPQASVPGAQRGGWYAFVFTYEGDALGGPSTEEFVEAVRAEGAPLDLDQFHAGQLHTAPLFTRFDRRPFGGGVWDRTRPWEENLWRGSLPTTEYLAAHNVRFPPTFCELPESFVRQSARALRKVLRATLPAEVPGEVVAAPAAAKAG